MSRQLRIPLPGALCHVTARGIRRDPIFRSDNDRLTWLSLLGDTCERHNLVIRTNRTGVDVITGMSTLRFWRVFSLPVPFGSVSRVRFAKRCRLSIAANGVPAAARRWVH